MRQFYCKLRQLIDILCNLLLVEDVVNHLAVGTVHIILILLVYIDVSNSRADLVSQAI